ncbi:MAG: hypothetical protein ACRC41_13650 [Sarcina sp.]
MKVYIINYYLQETAQSCDCGHDHDHDHSHARDDRNIVGEIKELGQWANLMPDCYLIKTEQSATQIAEKIKTVLEEKDMIFVTEVTKENCASFTPGVINWIQN